MELQALAAASGVGEKIRFLGQRDDVPSLLQAADVVCQVNEDPEAFGLIYVEALTAGKPVIAADQGGVTEVVDASCGALIPPGAAGVLADTLQKWVSNPQLRQQLGRAGVQRARECCDVDRQVTALNHFLGDCSENARLRR